MPAARALLVWIGVLGILTVPAQAQGFIQLTLDSTYTFRDHTFGHSLALDENVLFVGSPGDDNNGKYAGAVHLYRRSGDRWLPHDTLFASDGSTLHQFGYRLAQEGKHLLVNSWPTRRAVYVFEKENGVWLERGTLPLSDTTQVHGFGHLLALHDGVAFVGYYDSKGYGALAIYRHQNRRWVQQGRLGVNQSGENYLLGQSLCVVSNQVVVGGKDGVYVFRQEGERWKQEAVLTISEPTIQFGRALGCNERDIVVGDYSTGKTYAFERIGTAWQKRAPIEVPGGPDRFIEPIHIFGDYLFLTGDAPMEGTFQTKGRIYVFKRAEHGWVFLRMFSAPDPTPGDYFGYDLAMHGDCLVVGAPWHEAYIEGEGAVYLFSRYAFDRTLPMPEPEPTYALGFANNYPNPFSRSTTIRYSLPVPAPVRLRVYDVLGREVALLVDAVQEAGVYTVDFDAAGLPSGTYYLRYQVGIHSFTRSLLLRK